MQSQTHAFKTEKFLFIKIQYDSLDELSLLSPTILQVNSTMEETHIGESCRYFVSFAGHLFLFLFFFHLTICGSTNIPSDKILLNCGSLGESSFNGVNWIGDIGSSFLPPAYDTSSSSTLLVSNLDFNVPKIPYSTARIIHSSFTYSFPFSTGLKFIRIYFLSTSYLMMNPSKAYFSVKVGPYTLVSNFNPSVAAQELNLAYFTKDFLVNIREERLYITITPSSQISNSFASINGFEIFSVPLSVYFGGSKLHVPFLGHQESFFINDEYALEMLYRVDVGNDRHTVNAENAFGTWLEDFSYISGLQYGSALNILTRPISITYNTSSSDYNYSAPGELYWTARTMGSHEDANTRYNLTWSFPVDSGFKYVVRLHFCEISVEVTNVNQRVFKVYVNNQTAEERMDVVALAGAPFVPLYRDYVVMVPMESGRRQDMWISLHPNMESKPKYADAILNGIEIIKLSDSNNNLAASTQMHMEQKKKKISNAFVIVAGTLGAILGLFIPFFILVRRAWKRQKLGAFQVFPLKSNEKGHKNMQVGETLGQCYQFTLAEIRTATTNFSEALIIGEGGFGKVYKGFLLDGVTSVAIKRCNPSSRQGFREFQNEITFFSFYHMNLVSLLGYCREDNELILVYEYMAQGSLCDHLYRKPKQPLPWNLRLKICVGAARGLHYLHTGTRNPVIHRDVKSANILLDHNWVPKIADFGLSRVVLVPSSNSYSHVSTEVKGTFGYLDPEYYKRRKLTEKSDVYSFGVVLFEVLCGRPAVNPMTVEEESEKVGLAEWALHCHQYGTIDQLVDPHLEEKIDSECLMAFVDIGIKCLANRSAERPTMGEVLCSLEKIVSLKGSLEEQEMNTSQFMHEIVVNEMAISNRLADEDEQLDEITVPID